MTWYLEIGTLLIIVAGVLAAVWRFSPPTWKVVYTNVAAGALLLLGEVLSVLVGFDWTEVLPPEYAPWAGLIVLVLTTIARFKTTAPVGRPQDVK